MAQFQLSGMSFLFVENGKIREQIKGNLCKKEIDGKLLRDWLDEALKPQYEVKTTVWGYIIWDVPHNQQIASFHKNELFDAKKEAERLCERLNQEC